MGLFDQIKKAAESANNTEEIFTFRNVPQSVEELAGLPEGAIDTPYKTAALTVLALLNYETNKELTYSMLGLLKGPGGPISAYDKQFLKDRLEDKTYKAKSFFEGAVPENNYEPKKPLTIKVFSNPYSKTDETHMTLYLSSGGADNPRPIGLRLKPSTGEWFLNDQFGFLADIREPKDYNPWA